jgi:hypothetical protein
MEKPAEIWCLWYRRRFGDRWQMAYRAANTLETTRWMVQSGECRANGSNYPLVKSQAIED